MRDIDHASIGLAWPGHMPSVWADGDDVFLTADDQRHDSVKLSGLSVDGREVSLSLFVFFFLLLGLQSSLYIGITKFGVIFRDIESKL